MERYLDAKKVVSEILSEHEEVVTAQMLCDDHDEFVKLRAEAEVLRRVVERLTSFLPEKKRDQWRAKLRKHYTGMATGVSFDLGVTHE